MADKTVAVGDPARVDDMDLTVLYVDESRVRMGCALAANRKDVAAEIRAKHASKIEELEQAVRDAAEAAHAEAEKEGIEPKNLVKARTAAAKAKLDALTVKVEKDLAAVERGVVVSQHPDHVYWVPEHECWSIPGRFHAHPGGRGKRPADPAGLTAAAGR